jgi:DNA repair protein RadC
VSSQAPSDADLLAALLFDSTSDTEHRAKQILAHIGGIAGLTQLPPERFCAIPTLDETEQTRLTALAEWTRRAQQPPPFSRAVIQSAADAVRMIQTMIHLRQEHVCLILLDSQRQVLAIPTIYIGTVNMTILRTGEIFREVLAHNAPAFILAHNHPSGDPQPSPQDVQFTRTLLDAGRLLDVQLVDHLIIGRQGWSSLKEMGLGFK